MSVGKRDRPRPVNGGLKENLEGVNYIMSRPIIRLALAVVLGLLLGAILTGIGAMAMVTYSDEIFGQ